MLAIDLDLKTARVTDATVNTGVPPSAQCHNTTPVLPARANKPQTSMSQRVASAVEANEGTRP